MATRLRPSKIRIEWHERAARRFVMALALVAFGGAVSVSPSVDRRLVWFLVAYPLLWASLAAAWSLVAARRLTLAIVQAPVRVRAYDRGTFEVSLANDGWLPAFGVTIDGRLSGAHELTRLPAQGTDVLAPGEQIERRWGFRTRVRAPMGIGPFFSSLDTPGSPLRVIAEFSAAQPVAVLPVQYWLRAEVGEVLRGRRVSGGRFAPRPAATEDCVGVREYRPGDNPRLIHRVLSLRRAPDLFVKEFEDPSSDDICVVLDTSAPMAGDEAIWAYRFEKAVSFAVALTRALAARKRRVRVVFEQSGRQEIRIRPRQSDVASLELALAALALTDVRTTVLRTLTAETRKSQSVLFVSLAEVSEETLQPRLSSVSLTPNLVAMFTEKAVGQ